MYLSRKGTDADTDKLVFSSVSIARSEGAPKWVAIIVPVPSWKAGYTMSVCPRKPPQLIYRANVFTLQKEFPQHGANVDSELRERPREHLKYCRYPSLRCSRRTMGRSTY
jgi:hypothetical protein